MKTRSVQNSVISLLDRSFPGRCSSITPETDLVSDLDIDSMAMVSLIFSIDEEFGIGTDQLGDIVLSCRTVGDLISATEKLQHERA